jgi:hypothetical protein
VTNHAIEAIELDDEQELRAPVSRCFLSHACGPLDVAGNGGRAIALGGDRPNRIRRQAFTGRLVARWKEGRASGEIRLDTPPFELAGIFSGIFMYTVVSWLAAWQSAGNGSCDEAAELEGRLMRAFDVFLDRCRSHGSGAATGQRRDA